MLGSAGTCIRSLYPDDETEWAGGTDRLAFVAVTNVLDDNADSIRSGVNAAAPRPHPQVMGNHVAAKFSAEFLHEIARRAPAEHVAADLLQVALNLPL